MKDSISIKGRDGTFAAYIAKPKTLPASAVVVLQELFGVNADIREHCDALAEQGFLAVAPDLFWRQEPGVDLNVTSEADWDRTSTSSHRQPFSRIWQPCRRGFRRYFCSFGLAGMPRATVWAGMSRVAKPRAPSMASGPTFVPASTVAW